MRPLFTVGELASEARAAKPREARARGTLPHSPLVFTPILHNLFISTRAYDLRKIGRLLAVYTEASLNWK